METGKGAGREGVQPDTGQYPAIDRPRQRPFPSHPKGRVIRAPWCVEALKRGIDPVFRAHSATASHHPVSILVNDGSAP